ncbi:MAG: hypothetical protein ROZ09_11495 [Thiobacillus sp.]|jgi:hypothetical protein|uniref:hypothetical protein n=1 Tax=Thiobacillus sp. TaxID=924 RepID=UPI0028946570|nr:hypothetical protein [Thiobacillus sp.]MDT3707443.1 hypothetical protein [Thiobacillus sp.]
MASETRKFNYLAAITGVALFALLGGSIYALVAQQISFELFAATVGAPVSALIGWAARGAAVQP